MAKKKAGTKKKAAGGKKKKKAAVKRKKPAGCIYNWRLRTAIRNPVPVLREMLRRAPRERLHGERRIVRAARPHRRRAEDAEIRRRMRKAPAIDDVGRGIVAHARSAVRVRAQSHRAADRRALNQDRP